MSLYLVQFREHVDSCNFIIFIIHEISSHNTKQDQTFLVLLVCSYLLN
jgi:hypothetical protein